MLKLLGGLLLAGGCTAMGLQLSLKLTKRVTALETWRRAVTQLRAELSCRVCALPELAAHMAVNGPESLRGAFFTLAKNLQTPSDTRYAALWRQWAEGLPLQQEELVVVRELGGLLGRYELDSQLTALDSADAQLAQILAAATARKERLSKLYALGGLLCGIAIVVVLL